MRTLDCMMAIVSLIISVTLLFAMFRARGSGCHMREDTSGDIRWQRDACALQLASDCHAQREIASENTDARIAAPAPFDADRFRQVNDTCGRETGDRVLTRVAGQLKHSFRSQDFVCRIGGKGCEACR